MSGFTRAQRRVEERHARRKLAAAGCTCHPHFTCETPPPGVELAWSIRHRLGCPLGDRFLADNLNGYMPVLVDRQPSTTRCGR